jgi:ABC-type lipoprotein release transport system permease subunit
MGTLAGLAWRNMWRNWRRTAIAVVAIVLGLTLLLFFDGLIRGSDQAIFGNAVRLYGGNVLVHAPGYRERSSRLPLLPLADAEPVLAAARARLDVTSATRRIHTSGLVSKGSDSHAVVITGIEPGLEAPTSIVAENMAAGRFLLDGEGDAILIGRELAELLGVGVGDRVSLVGQGRGEQLHQRQMVVVGVFDLGMGEAERNMAYITLNEAQEIYRLRDQVTEVAVNLNRVGEELPVIAELQAALPGYEVDSWYTLRPEVRETLDMKLGFTSFIGLVVVIIACIGILNLMLMAVFERTREMGVLAALGMKGRQVMLLFLMEGTLIGVLGAALGCLVGWVLLWLVGRVGIDLSYASGMGGDVVALLGDRLYPATTLSATAIRGVTVVFIAALASLYPAWLASRKQPADVLRHV